MLKFLRQVEKSQTLLINEQSRLMQESGKEIYKLGFGQSPFSPPERVIRSLKDNISKHGYIPVQGLSDLREAATKFHNEKQGFDFNPEFCLIAPGSKMLIYSVMAAFKKADILIPAPAWVSYAPQAQLLGHNIVRVKSSFGNRWRVTAEELEKSVSECRSDTQKIMIINYPGNPDGLVYSADELKDIAEISRKYSILIIADEIYSFLNFGGDTNSIAKFYPEGTIVTTGLSKWCGAGGWRLGIAFLPDTFDELKETMLGIASETYSCVSAPISYAAIEAYKNDEITDKFLQDQRGILSIISTQSTEILSAAGVGVHKAEGGFYLFLDFMPLSDQLRKKGLKTSEELCLAILEETGVALLHSAVFGIEESYLSARLAFIDFDGTKALKAAETEDIDNKFVEKYCGRTIGAVMRLSDWVSDNCN